MSAQSIWDSVKRWIDALSGLSVIATMIFIALQWREMRLGSADTHDLAVAAAKQADRMKDLADRMKDQADRTKELADQATTQAKATQVAAKAAERAANIANQSLHMSERAYLLLGPPNDDFAHKRINIPVVNSGHMPSGPTTLVIHEATFRLDDPSAKIIPFGATIERHWSKISYQSVPIVPLGSLFSAEVRLPAIVQDQLNNGKQAIVIAATLTYSDGFPKTPKQTVIFCDASSYASQTNLFTMRPCDNPNIILQALVSLDGYPDPKYQQQ